MATEKRISAMLKDLDIVLVCTETDCRARITIPLKSWKKGEIVSRCPNCRRSFETGELLALKTPLLNAIERASELPFEIRLEFPDR